MPHLTLEIYLMVLTGELPAQVLVELGFPHLLESCGSCKSHWETYREKPVSETNLLREDEVSPAALEAWVAPAFGNAAAVIDRKHSRLVEHRKSTRRDLRELLATPRDERHGRIQAARTRFRSRAFAELLIEESRNLVRTDPEEAASLAGLVYTVLLWTPLALEKPWGHAMHVLSLANQANAERVRGNFEAAGRLFSEARREMARHGLLDRSVFAEVSSLEASLRLDQRRWEEGEWLVDRAILVYRQAGDDEGLARTLVQRAVLHRQQGRAAEAAEDLRRAMPDLVPKREISVYLCAVGTLGLALCDLEQFDEARRLLLDTEPWWDEVDEPWWTLRLRMLEGRIALGLGDLARAERMFSDVLATCREQEAPYDAALAALDLALVHLAQGRTAEVARLAREAAPVFRSRAIHREALACLALVQKAALAETLTTETTRQARAYLEQARHRPELIWQKA